MAPAKKIGRPVSNPVVPVYRLPYSTADIAYVQKHTAKVLRRGYLTDGGEYVKTFEKQFAAFCGQRYAVAVNSGTTALELILKCINIRRCTVIVPTYTFFATPLSVYNAGGKPIFADINKATLSLSLASIKKHARRDTKAVILVHVGGLISPEITAIRRWCDKRGIALIEDAACAHGATWRGKPAGSFGHAAAFSFHHSKVLTTGEGGMVVTKNTDWANTIRKMRAVGLDRTKNNWEAFELGNNYKLSEVPAVLGLLHMKKARRILTERRSIAKRYDMNVAWNKKVQAFPLPAGSVSAYYKYVMHVQNPEYKIIIRERLAVEHNVLLPPNVYDHLCHDQAITPKMGAVNWREAQPHSQDMRDHTLCLPLYNGLRPSMQRQVISGLNHIIGQL